MSSVQRPQRLSLPQQCAESIKLFIAEHTLKPGDKLPTEQEWIELLGVSRLVVREALQVLAGIGLIDVQQGRGAFVRDGTRISVFDQVTFGLDLQQLSFTDVLEARAMLDLAVVELCMLRADEAAFEELEHILHRMQQLEAASESIDEVHRVFHQRLLRAAGNPLIERVGLMLLDTFWRIGDRMPGLVRVAAQPDDLPFTASHRALLAAIKSRDFALSRHVVDQHLPFEPGTRLVFPLVAQAANQPSDQNTQPD